MDKEKKNEQIEENSKKSIWYKTWWGVLLVLCIWPFFLTWYVWKKTNWSQKNKWIATGVIALVFIIFASSGDSSSTEKKDTAKKTENATSQETSKQAETKPVFDIPSLVGKNIDEVRTILGAPIEKEMIEPNQAQLNLGTTQWDNTFEKDNTQLLVTFNVSTRKVIEFFIGTSPEKQNKEELLQKGNLQTGSSKYKLDYVKALKDPAQITGVTITPN